MPKKSLKQLYFTKRSLIFLSLGIFFLILFTGFTLLVRANSLNSFDFDTTVRLQDQTPLRMDTFFSSLSVIGRFEYTTPALFLVLLIWSRLKPRRVITVFVIMGLFAFAHVIELAGKMTLEHPGPPHMFLRSHFSDFPGLYVHTQASYPSGHSLRTVALGVIFTYIIWTLRIPLIARLATFVFFAVTTAVMLYSRVSLGEHWTTDVIGGTLLGLSMALLSILLLV